MDDPGDLSLWHELFSSKKIAAGLLLLLLLVLAGGGGLFLVQEGRLKQQAEDDLVSIAWFKIKQIENWRHERLGDGATVSRNPFFLQGVGRFLRDALPDDEGDLREFFRTLREYYKYSDAALIGSDKTVRLRSGAASARTPWLAQALDQARAEGRPVLTDIHPLSAGGMLHLDVVAPLFAGGQPSGTFLGWLVLQTPAAQFLYPLLQVWPTHSRTAETLLVRRDGDDVVYLNELRHRQDAAPGLRIPVSETAVLAVRAVLGARGLARGLDYRDRDVLGVVLPVPGTPWLLISKMDSDEIHAAWRQQALYILVLMGCLLGGGVVVALLLRQYGLRTHYQTLYKAEATLRDSLELQAVTLGSIGDAVIAVDVRGRVTLFNAAAEGLTGWSAADAAGRPLAEVFRIIDGQTRELQENPLAQVLARGAPAELADNTLLVARDGSERPIADSAAPIRDARGELVGMVLVFRDNSAERRARLAKDALGASEAKYRELVENAQSIIVKVDAGGHITFFNEYARQFFGYAEDEILGHHVVGTIVPETDSENRDMAGLVREILDQTDADGLVEHENRRRDGSRVWVRWANKTIRDGSGRSVGTLAVGTDVTARRQAETALRRSREDLKRAQAMAITGNWRLDVATGALDWSEESYRIFGVAPGSAMNLERFMDCVHPDDRDMLWQHWEAALGGERYDIEHRIVAEGEVKWVRERAVLERDAAGSLRYVFGVVQDITEHKYFERFKAVNAARNQALIELADMQAATPDALTQAILERAVMLTESEIGYLHFVAQDQVHLNLIHWSTGVRQRCQADRMTHYPLAEAGIWADCLRAGQPARHNDYARAAGAKGLPQGHIPLARHFSVPIREGEGYGAVLGVGNKREPYDDVDVAKLQSFVTDAWQILQRKLAVDALRQSEERFRQLVENAPDAIFVQTGGRFVYVNKACLALYGMDSPEAMLGKPVLERFHPDFHGRVLERMRSVMVQRQVQPPMEQRHVRADGSLLDVEASSVPTSYDGRDGVMVFVRDIAERKRLETLREDMDRIIRHDLKTPLNAILSLPQLLLMDDNLTDEQRQFLGYIMDAGYKMLGLVNLSLDLFRMERGTYELVPARVELLRVVGRALADLEPMRQARELSVNLFCNGRPAAGVVACQARAEELLCYSLFSNLIKNALEASPQGAMVTLDCVQDTGGWRVDIHNQGETPEAIRDRFFDKYVTMGKAGGTGLGTYSARLMAATMGGAIALDASQAGATMVSVWLPAWDMGHGDSPQAAGPA